MAIDKFFKDAQGKTVIFQPPNPPIIIWFVATIAAKVFSTGSLHDLFSLVAFGAIFVWASLEITQGTTYFRRTLGVLVLLFSLYTRLY